MNSDYFNWKKSRSVGAKLLHRLYSLARGSIRMLRT